MTAPAIRTAYDERYSDIERIDTIGSDTRFHRGFGETGTRVLLVDFGSLKSADSADCADGSSDMTPSVHAGCPRCGEDEMILSLDLNPEGYDDAAFYCTNIKCPHFVGDEVEYDMDKIRADHPEEWDNTAECPDCGKRFTTTLKKGIHTTHEYVKSAELRAGSTVEDRRSSKGDASGGVVGDVVCDDCTPKLSSADEAKEEM